MFATIHHVQLAMPAGREDEARTFFVGALGMIEVDKPPVLAARGGAWFRGGGVELHLGVEEPFAPARKAHPGLVVDDIAEAARRVATTGRDVAWDTDFPGFRRFYAHDPFGNRLEFLQPL
ncbi:VOC family protein [Actinomycetospora termitidis]|uniref:VOC family protein n=1 Tax=Actinomycetospora termitidis TaxID=3053470 RepID=A0ABT7M9P4_9PSEU|nr:VOC family protein [Actinomycetospora sp. Odt1-22]MDL5157387.1 VOC family protein [Actinomycetospora sp. Odt1-22]